MSEKKIGRLCCGDIYSARGWFVRYQVYDSFIFCTARFQIKLIGKHCSNERGGNRRVELPEWRDPRRLHQTEMPNLS